MAGLDAFSLEGKAAIVTGASRGIGRAIALAYAEAGADVAVISRSVDELSTLATGVRRAGRRCVALPCDVTEPEEVRRAVEGAVGELGRIDVLVNNAGGPLFNAPFVEITDDGWRRSIELNLMSVVYACQAVGPRMLEQRSGSVINVDSIGADHPGPEVAPYCAAKAAVVNLTWVLAQEWGPSGVRVNTIAPGWVRTAINRKVYGRAPLAAAIQERIPMRRWGEPEDVVGAALWLASDASAYVTGAHIPIDGGVGVVAPQAPGGPRRN